MTQQKYPRPYDPRCGKFADEHPEYIDMASDEGGSPAEYAREDGTFNPENGHFLCTECYVAIGCPGGPNGWTCP